MERKIARRFSMRKLLVIISVLSLLLSFNATSVFAEETLTSSQIQTLHEYGYPSAYDAYINQYYNDWLNNVDYYSYGSWDAFSTFCYFVGSMAYASSASGLEDYSIVARGLYTEVSDHPGTRLTELDHISDCLINRIQSTGTPYWTSYYTAATVYGLDFINPSSNAYWAAPCGKNPLADSAYDSEARLALITSYCYAWDHIGITYAASFTRHSDLPTNLLYFSEANSYGSHQAGSFYFRAN